MMTTRSLATRALPAALTSLLVTTVLLATSAGVSRAEPPQATAGITAFSCDLGNAPYLGYRITAAVDDKGRWLDVEWEVVADTGEREGGTLRHDSRGLDVFVTGAIFPVSDLATHATATVRIVDNRGLTEASDASAATCAL